MFVNVLICALLLVCLNICVEGFVVPSTRMSILKKQTNLFSLFHELAEKGDFEAVKEMLEKDPTLITKYDIDGQLALHHAAKNGFYEMVEYLVEKNPGMINFYNIRWRTPLHWSASYAGYEGYERCKDISLYLVAKGGNLNFKNKDQVTPLDLAKKGPLGKKFVDELKEAAKGVEVRPIDIGVSRVYWG